MSYNYDLNPWDDTAQGAQTTNQQQATPYQSGYNTGASAYSAASNSVGYGNPTAQYNDQNDWNNDQYNSYSSDPVQQLHPGSEQYGGEQQQQQQQQQQPSSPPPPPSGFTARFLRTHVPFCGACMDITSPVLDALLKYVNRDLLASKIFYFFFYSAFGSLFPLMGVYFKQLGMNPAQVGILTGVRPFIEIFSAPFWNSLAERFKKSKLILLFSLISWIVFTYSLAHIRPPASACVAFNDTDYVLYTPYSENDLSNYDVSLESGKESGSESFSNPENERNKENNEFFMNKIPQVVEGKDEILASEENVNDQGKRRRRKRSYRLVWAASKPYEQIERPSHIKYKYTYNSNSENNNNNNNDEEGRYLLSTAADLEPHVEIELENDFEDLTLFGPTRSKRSLNPNEDDDVPVESEFAESRESDANLELPEQRRASKLRVSSEQDEGSNESDEEDEDNERQAEEENEISGKQRGSKMSHHDSGTGEASSNGELAQESLEIKENNIERRQEGVNKTKRVYKQRHKTPPTHIVGMSPITVEYTINYNKEKHSQFVTPMFSTIVYKLDDIKEVFFLLLLLISLGEFFSAPAITIADSTTLNCLGENTDLYGRQRMFGSIGWAITLLLVGMALDNSKTIADHPCGPHQRERSYTVCFTIFSLLMGCAFITATQFKFSYPSKGGKSSDLGPNQELVTKTVDDNTVITTTVDSSQAALTNVDDLYASTRPREIFNTAPPVNAPPPGSQQADKEKFEFIDKWKSAVFAQSTWEPPEWVGVFRQFRNTMHLTYLFITWFLGCGVGLVFTFLFWHLQDVGGTPTLFGICSVVNHISEILAYFFSSHVIKRFGHTKVLSIGLSCNIIRFLYVAFLSNPYYALPFELVQGITHAACFAACCSYMSHVSKPELKASTQGVMQGLHNGIGRACGALIGGYMINAIGSRASFCIYGLLSGCVLAGFLYARKKASDNDDVKVVDDENLGDLGAPQGVPSALPGKITQASQLQDVDYQW